MPLGSGQCQRGQTLTIDGYTVIDKESTETAAWLNSAGFTALVLKYRTPNHRAGALLEMPKRALSLACHSLLDAWAKFERCFLSP